MPEHLPVVAVPLLEPDGDVLLDVQAAFTATFNKVSYDLLIDYAAAPPPPDLTPEGLAWVDAVLRAGAVRTP
jgi:hypothetical protein